MYSQQAVELLCCDRPTKVLNQTVLLQRCIPIRQLVDQETLVGVEPT